MHELLEYRAVLPGVEAVSLISDRQFPRHSHDQFGIGVITSGGHRSWSSIGWVDPVCGDVIMVNPGEMHDGSSLDGRPRGWKMLFFEPQVVREMLVDVVQSDSTILQPTAQDRSQRRLFGRLFNALTGSQSDALHIEEGLVRTLARAFRHHTSQRPCRLEALPDVEKIVKLIDAEPENALSLQTMSHLAGVSRFHFLRAFVRVTGATPHAYILQRRIRLARRLLSAGIEPVQVSVESGFADQSHLTRTFVRQLGVTPSRYRQVTSEPRREQFRSRHRNDRVR